MFSPSPGRLGKPEPNHLRLPVPAISGLVAALTLLAEIIFARSLGTLDWHGCFCGGRARTWSVGTTATVWFAAVAVLAGVTFARRLAKRPGTPSRSAYVSLLVPTTVGMLLTFPIVVALASSAKVSGGTIAGLDAGLALPAGAMLGAALTVAATSYPLLARGIWISVAWVWVLGLISVVVSWRDEVGQSVPLGATHIGDPGSDAMMARTTHDVAQAILSGLAVLGPAALAVWLTYRVMRKERPVWQAVGSGVVGPLAITAAYLLRPDAVSGANAAGLSLVAKALVLAVIASVVTVFIFSLSQQPSQHRAESRQPPIWQRPLGSEPDSASNEKGPDPVNPDGSQGLPTVIDGVVRPGERSKTWHW